MPRNKMEVEDKAVKVEGSEDAPREGGVRKSVPKAVVRRRNNARIKKMVLPKAPVQVLNELVGPGNVSTKVMPSNSANMMGSPRMFSVQITVEEEDFSGCGPTKAMARNLAAEAAVHKIAMARFQQKSENANAKNGREDNTPWGALASLALFKLFSDWRANGYTLPSQLCTKELETSKQEAYPGGVGGSGGKMDTGFDFTDESGAFHNFQTPNKQSNNMFNMMMSQNASMMRQMGVPMKRQGGMGGGGKVAPTGKGAPAGDEKHPVSLLLEKRGKDNPVEFECSEEGEMPKKTYIMTCKIDKKSYTGKADAKEDLHNDLQD